MEPSKSLAAADGNMPAVKGLQISIWSRILCSIRSRRKCVLIKRERKKNL